MKQDKNYSRALAKEMIALNFADLSAADIEQLNVLLMDQIAVAQHGASTPWGTAVRNYATRFDGTGSAPVFASTIKVAPEIAALANGTATHGYELDDTHDASLSHPGAVVIPAAVATAIEHRATGMDLLAAIAAGYEANGRIGRAANAREVIEFGHHPTGVFCGFGAVAAVAKLRGLGVDGLSCAWGHMLSLAGGSMQFSDEPHGTAVKRTHPGYAAQHAILAVEMAMAGVSAPEKAIDGRFGFLTLFGHQPQVELLQRQGDARLEIHNVSIKPYSCCRMFHSTIDALEQVTDGFKVDVDTIEKVVIRGPEAHAHQHMITRPTSVMAAQYSMPYIVGATLAAGPHAYDAYGEARHKDSKILTIVDKVEAATDREIEAKFPEQLGSGVDITYADGTVRSATVYDSIGTPGCPMDMEQVCAKASALGDLTENGFDVAAARLTITELATGNDASQLVDLIRATDGLNVAVAQ